MANIQGNLNLNNALQLYFLFKLFCILCHFQLVSSTFSSYEVKKSLQDLVPLATSDQIDSALSSAGGDVDAAAQHLLGECEWLL